jgi:hypothetical protein
MTVTKDVIEDLIPVYLAGEASADTRKLVEEFMAAHPGMLGVDLPETKVEPPKDPDCALQGRRERLLEAPGWRAAALSFGVFSFAFHGKEITFLLFRDAPLAAYALLAGSAFCYAMFYWTCRHLVVTGLGAPHSPALWAGLAAVASIPFATVMSAHIGWGLVPAAFAGMALAKSLNRSYAIACFTTFPATSVSRKSRPWKRKVSLVWSMPNRCRIVAWMSCT